MLKYTHRKKSMKVPFIIYADLESLLETMGTCHNNPKKLSKTKINKHTVILYSYTVIVVILYLLIVHLMLQKINLVIIEVKTI